VSLCECVCGGVCEGDMREIGFFPGQNRGGGTLCSNVQQHVLSSHSFKRVHRSQLGGPVHRFLRATVADLIVTRRMPRGHLHISNRSPHSSSQHTGATLSRALKVPSRTF